MTRRIERAMALLRQGATVTDACFAVGCVSLGSFSSRFTEIVGESPSAYRQRDHRPSSLRQQGPDPTTPKRAVLLNPNCVDMAVNVSKMFITVLDHDEALRFYRDALGLEVRQDVENNGFRWVTLGAPAQDIDIVLSQPHGGRSPADGDALSALVTQGPMPAAIFSSDDLEATFDRLVESGAEVLEEPTDQFLGCT